jgi:hypothetical protein
MDEHVPDLPVSLAAVSAAFALPADLDVVAFHRGAIGAWRLRSAGSGEEWSLKVLPETSPGYRLAPVRTGGALERRALAAGIAIAPPVKPVGPAVGLAARVDDHLAWMHRWIDGPPVDAESPPTGLGEWLGTIVAALHALCPADRSEEEDIAQAYGLHPRGEWQSWFDEAEDADLPWTALGPSAMPPIAEASALVRAALALVDLGRAISHRDINPVNVLLGPDGPTLIDFSYSGIEVPWLEIVDASHAFGQRGPETLEAYRRAGGAPGPEITEALARDSGATLNYLAYTMWVSLGHRPITEEQQLEATERVPELVANLTRQVESLEVKRLLLFGR